MFALLCVILTPVLASGIGNICPYTDCECHDTSISCDYHKLTTLPELNPVSTTNTWSLSLFNNNLTAIPAGGLPPRLSEIELQMNPIKTIEKTAFDGSADTLTDLSFSEALFTELPSAFLNLNTLKQLIIADTSITDWDVEIINHVGLTLETLILSNVGLVTWPTWIHYLPHLGTLDLSSMTFTVPDDAFNNQATTLFSLSFENCSLTEIPNAVSKLTTLKTLELDSNQITRLSAISNSTTLTTLSLNNNNISDAVHLNVSLNHSAGSLTFLELRNNKLTALPDLSSLTKLDTLFLTQNDISLIGDSKIPSSTKTLDLEYNNLPSLYYFLQTGVNLGILRFHSNSVRELRGEDIPATVSLIDAGINLITELTDTSFPPNSAMTTLSLDANPISKISSSAFANLLKLSFISLRYTKMTRLPLSLSALSNLQTADLSNNSALVCTCMEKDLRNWSTHLQYQIKGECSITSIYNFLQVLSYDCPD